MMHSCKLLQQFFEAKWIVLLFFFTLGDVNRISVVRIDGKSAFMDAHMMEVVCNYIFIAQLALARKQRRNIFSDFVSSCHLPIFVYVTRWRLYIILSIADTKTPLDFIEKAISIITLPLSALPKSGGFQFL